MEIVTGQLRTTLKKRPLYQPYDPSTWQPNLHAHIIWDWMNHETGKSFKLGKKDMEELQDMAAETLDMERGQRKAETGREHLEHNDFILFQQKKQSAELDIEIAKKRDKLNTENGNAIKSGMANLLGKGKYAPDFGGFNISEGVTHLKPR